MADAADIHEFLKPSCRDESVTIVDTTNNPPSVVTGVLDWTINERNGDHVFNVLGVSFIADDVTDIDPDNSTIWIRS